MNIKKVFQNEMNLESQTINFRGSLRLNFALFLFPEQKKRHSNYIIMCLRMENFTIAIALMVLKGISIGS